MWLKRPLRIFILFSAIVSISPAWSKALSGPEQLDLLAELWTGFFSNELQVRREALTHEPAFPEAVRLVRDFRVWRLDASQLGEYVLYIEEIKSDNPGKANRQRVHTLHWDSARGRIHIKQHFFSTELAYDQDAMGPEKAAALSPGDFTLVPGCDIYVRYDPELKRFKGQMQRRQCRYVHPGSGEVYADYGMILSKGHFWYRDRSIKEADAAVRGEIDGFSWLRFRKMADQPRLGNGDRISKAYLRERAPLTLAQEGTWEGTFTRVDDQGAIIEQVPSRIIVRFLEDGAPYDYAQVNITSPGTPQEKRIETFGKWDVDRLAFSNRRLDGWAKDLSEDALGRSAVYRMEFKDGSGMSVSEIISLSADGTSRMRAAQYMKDGAIVRRTLINERKVD